MFEVGDRVLLTTMEREGVITKLWPDGGAYITEDNGSVTACGVDILVYADPARRNQEAS